MANPFKISLIRHGHVHNPSYIFYGRLPKFKLSDRGVAQARGAAQLLKDKPLDAIYSSPLLRTRQTARQILWHHPRLQLKISKLLNEVYTPFEGKPGKEVDGKKGDIYTGIEPPYEQPAHLLRRMHRFIEKMQTAYPKGHVAAVTHGDLIAFMIVWAKHLPIVANSKLELGKLGIAKGYPQTGSVTTFYFTEDVFGKRPEFTHEIFDPHL